MQLYTFSPPSLFQIQLDPLVDYSSQFAGFVFSKLFLISIRQLDSFDLSLLSLMFSIEVFKSFLFCCPQIVRPMNAFLVVDVQNDFISGSLNISNCSAQQNGIEVSAKSPIQCLAMDRLDVYFFVFLVVCSFNFRFNFRSSQRC